MSKKKLELTQAQKEKIVEDLNNEAEQEIKGNTTLVSLHDMPELAEYIRQLTPMEMFEKSVAMNNLSLSSLEGMLDKLSKRYLIRLIYATLKLPDANSNLKFGGSKLDQEQAAYAYYHMQAARNALIHVLGTTAIAQAKLQKQKEQEAQAEQDNEKQEESNEQV